MADTKITALVAISTVDPAADVLPIVDISDASMAASGTTKKVTTNQILQSGGTATLASATISGDLTVDTSTLKVDSANNRVGVGTASPNDTLTIASDNYLSFQTAVTTLNSGRAARIGAISSGTGNGFLSFETYQGGSGGGERYRLASDGVATWSNVGGVAGTAMTLNATGLGVGVVPSSFGRFSVQGTAGGAGILGVDTDATRCDIQAYNKPLALNRAGNNILMCEGGGNVGIGVTPAGTGGCLQLKSGITFPATQVASSDANTLDDYEEGTFTPTITGSTAAGVGTYSNQIGRYTKIGNQVTVWIRISWSAHTGTGDMRISDLPFAIANVNNLGPGAAIGYSANITLTAGNYLMLYGNPGTTRIDFWQTPTGGGVTATVSMDSSADIGITMTYIV